MGLRFCPQLCLPVGLWPRYNCVHRVLLPSREERHPRRDFVETQPRNARAEADGDSPAARAPTLLPRSYRLRLTCPRPVLQAGPRLMPTLPNSS